MTPNDQPAAIQLLEQSQPPAYYCPGCGKPLPRGSKARFHADCRRRDKRRRIAQRRQRDAQRETQRLGARLRHLKCPDCGASLAKLLHPNPRHTVEVACDVAQRALEPLNSQERRDGPEAATEPATAL
jgi:predicted RNA-binding Zn-ribbon protein involved in translation (DUF1610 family)